MENANATQTQARPKNDLVLVKETNEWGQISDLEKNATYFVIRKPTRELTKEKSREFVEDVRAFLHEHRVLSEKQFDELNQRYGEPAKQRAKELRESMEKKFDELTKEFEARVEQLETEYKTRFGKKDAPPASTTTAETPGEMPTGEHVAEPAASETVTPGESKAKQAPKKTAKKAD